MYIYLLCTVYIWYHMLICISIHEQSRKLKVHEKDINKLGKVPSLTEKACTISENWYMGWQKLLKLLRCITYIHTYIYIYIYMYVCMHACMHACMHVCMYVCMYVCVCVYIYCAYIYIVHIIIYICIHTLCTYNIHVCSVYNVFHVCNQFPLPSDSSARTALQ